MFPKNNLYSPEWIHTQIYLSMYSHYYKHQTLNYIKSSQRPNIRDVHISTVCQCFIHTFNLQLYADSHEIVGGDAPELTNRAYIQSESSLQTTQQYVINAEADVLETCTPTSWQRAVSHLSVFAGNTVKTVVILRVWNTEAHCLCYHGAADWCAVLDRCCHCGLGVGEHSRLSAQRDSRVDCGQWKFDAGSQTREMGRLVHTAMTDVANTFSIIRQAALTISHRN